MGLGEISSEVGGHTPLNSNHSTTAQLQRQPRQTFKDHVTVLLPDF